jgi:2-polyprenyl-6-methoxyphenol hydroxylase-like FAD-dependent oxidoreductase
MPDATDDARVCRGVLSTWESSDPQFYDYGLLACEAAIAIDRSSYDDALVAAAQTAGAAVICGDGAARVVHHRGSWTVEFDRTSLQARWLIDASGRGGGLAPTHTSRRCFSDRLVACVIQARCVASGPCSDVLCLPPSVAVGGTCLSRPPAWRPVVYLTDADLLPRSALARSIHLARAFDEASLLREGIGAAPAFSPHRVVDARTSHRLRVGGDGWMAIGDAALSVDPLSGEGLRLAIASAARACDAITDGGRGLPAWESLAAWYGDQRTEQRHAAAAANATVVPGGFLQTTCSVGRRRGRGRRASAGATRRLETSSLALGIQRSPGGSRVFDIVALAILAAPEAGWVSGTRSRQRVYSRARATRTASPQPAAAPRADVL